MAAICKARLLSDLTGQTPCDQEATSLDGRLCAFHSRQCQGLYRGYKKRNEELDVLSDKQPQFLANTTTSIVIQDFKDVEDEDVLREIHDYLFRKYNLLERVIRARKLHHSHFFVIDHDYGHEKYLNKLQNEKHVTAKALERLGKRGAQLMYKQKEWFSWIKQCQEVEENQRENESRKIKLEAMLFKRHQREVVRRQEEMKLKENEKLGEEYLEQAYQQRLSEMSKEEQDQWDPVQDIFGYERDNYVELIKFFLMLKEQDLPDEPKEEKEVSINNIVEMDAPEKSQSKSAKKRAKKANAELKKASGVFTESSDGRGPSIIEMETRSRMRERLQKPVKYERTTGWYLANDEAALSVVDAYSSPLPDDEIEALLDEVAEVKHFLFCRLLLSHATLLPVALKAESIDEFLSDESITQDNLRDLCLKLERPPLQDVRDACADFIRGENEEELEYRSDSNGNDEEDDGCDYGGKRIPEKYKLKFRDRSGIPGKYQTKREKAAKKKRIQPHQLFGPEESEGVLDFGKVTNERDYSRKRTRIKVCGRYMYNYPSEKALNRGGWYHFAVIAKDSNLFDAVELCRNWNEFYELNILCLYHYFPAAKWTRFVGDLLRQQLLQLGFVPYFVSDKADKVTHHFQSGSRGMARRQHQIVEMRNFICGQVKRDDPVSRRFIQYLSMETWGIRALVRDRKTGRILIQPPEEELWLLREKSGWGRANRNDFDILAEVGPAFFEKMDAIRQWHLGFEEYYDVYIWDPSPGRSYYLLQRKLEETLARALRVRELKDMFSAVKHIISTITKDPESDRTRSIKPGESATSLWDSLDTRAKAWDWSPSDGVGEEGLSETYKYTEADELEDTILFPEEATGQMRNHLFKENPSALDIFERKPVIDLRRFAEDLDTDDELTDEDNYEYLGEEDINDLKSGDDDDGWEDESNSSDDDRRHRWEVNASEGEAETAIDLLSEQFKQMSTSRRGEPDYFVPIIKTPSIARELPANIRTHSEDLMATCRIAMMQQKEYSNSHASMEADFFRHIDREKSKVFKHSWHCADITPEAIKKWVEWNVMVGKMDDFVMTSGFNAGPFELCQFMKMASHFQEERRTVKDAFDAYAAIALFFETKDFVESDDGSVFRDSKLFDQVERAKHVPDRRTHMSNKTLPRDFWNEWDELVKGHDREVGADAVDDIYPIAWRKTIRSVVVQLFRAGIICRSYSGEVAGVATAKAEPGRGLDLYIDYRIGIPMARIVSQLTDPRPFDRDYIVSKAGQFANQHASARFAVLRLWSAAHFYPLMLGIDKRPMCSFLDDRGRAWDFRFIPKDMPYSEWSVHQQLSLRIAAHKDIFGNQAFVAKDLVLVMGKDEQELRRLSEGVTWAIQTKPWRLEVDFWRSFVSVDVQFLEGLDRRWLE